MSDIIEKSAMRKVYLRIVGFSCVLLFFNYLDRVNVGFAAAQMNVDLGFSAAVYGFGAGVFFVGYALFEIPSNLMLRRFGARIWIARIMITWGIISMMFVWVSNETHFYILRFLLGVAEAGFIPGIILYFTSWVPSQHRAKAYSGFFGAILLSSIIGAPVSGAIIQTMDGTGVLRGWQWMFLLEGVPSVILGFVVLAVFRNDPTDAGWLSHEEKLWLKRAVARSEGEAVTHGSVGQFLRDPQVLKPTAMYFFNATATYGVVFWLPLIIKDVGGTVTRLSPFQVGLLTAVPYLCALVAQQILARSSDRSGDRKWHVTICLLLGAAGLLGAGAAGSPFVGFAFICLAAVGLQGSTGVFRALPTTYLSGVAAAGGLAFINSVAQVGGFIGPNVIGTLKTSAGGYHLPLCILAGCALAVSLIGLTLEERQRGLAHPTSS